MEKILPYLGFIIAFIILTLFEVSLAYSIGIAVIIGGLLQRFLNVEHYKDMSIHDLSNQESDDLYNIFSDEIQIVKDLGYSVFDEFSLKNKKKLMDSLFFINQNFDTIISFSQMNLLNNPVLVSVSSLFEDSYSLSTSSSKLVGNVPYIEKLLIQIFENADIMDILNKHQHSINFLIQKDFKPDKFNTYSYREYVIESNKLVFEHFGKYFLFKSIIYMLNDKYKDYTKLIEDQELEFES